MNRHDYAYPFRIDPASGQAAQTGYESHVEQMIRQVLLTSPGERVNLPEFGCGLRQLIFAPLSEPLTATVQLLVFQALDRWLEGKIEVNNVEVIPPEEAGESTLLIRIDYTLIGTLSGKQMEVRVI
ncbi:MAG: GPW/gp25 family protein [Armatimonadota bacterium]|nr:GPW/gp25 family protein [Armatimonadota bacterium]